MTIQRISTYSSQQTTLRDVNRVQAELGNLQKQLSSGYKADRFQDLPGQVEQFVSLESKMDRSDMYIVNNSQISSRLQFAQSSLQNLVAVADDMEDLVALSRNGAVGDSLNFTQQMSSLRDTAIQMLNTSFEGRFIFGGTRTNIPPVKTDPFPDNIEAGVPDAAYYQGSEENLTARIEDNFSLDYTFRADDEAFQSLFAGVNLSISANGEDNDEDMTKAFELIQEGLKGIIDEETRINANIVITQDVTERHNTQKLYWQGLKESIINTDVIGVSTQVAVDQALLQSAFQSFSTISRLRLVDFL